MFHCCFHILLGHGLILLIVLDSGPEIIKRTFKNPVEKKIPQGFFIFFFMDFFPEGTNEKAEPPRPNHSVHKKEGIRISFEQRIHEPKFIY